MEFPDPGVSLAPGPIGLGRKVMRRVTLVPARREYQKVSAADLPSLGWSAAALTDKGAQMALPFNRAYLP